MLHEKEIRNAIGIVLKESAEAIVLAATRDVTGENFCDELSILKSSIIERKEFSFEFPPPEAQ